ncbi:MAG: FMN-binding protein [Bacteroidales bacterium]|nr:FMN-binding protein [Bacteroidales bacterium]
MKKWLWTSLCAVALTTAVAVILGCTTSDEHITKKDGVYIVNTTKLGADVQGYNGPTPLNIYIKDNKIQKVEALPNEETPGFFQRVQSELLGKWNGMDVKKAATAEIDAVTGATYSSNAVKENVKIGVKYYQKHKK